MGSHRRAVQQTQPHRSGGAHTEPEAEAGRRGDDTHETAHSDHTGVVSENMHILGAKLRKLPGKRKYARRLEGK